MPKRPPAATPGAPGAAKVPRWSSASVASAIALAYAAGLGSRVLLPAGGDPPPSTADAFSHTTHPDMATDGFNWTQLSMSRANNFPSGTIKYLDAATIKERGAMHAWHTTFARSIPALVSGLGDDVAASFSGWRREDYRRHWGGKDVVVAFSPDEMFQRGVLRSGLRRLQAPHRQRMRFDAFLDAQAESERVIPPLEHVAVQQSPSRDLSDFGLPPLPPFVEELVSPTLQARNLWVAAPPKTSVLHYDWQDSVLLQVSGTKRFTLIDPARLHTAYPAVMLMENLVRTGAGQFEPRLTSREVDNFPLANITHPDYDRHPLLRDAHVMTVEVPAGSALFLPAYWFHQVESFAAPGELNVAVNYWFQGHSLATRLYRTLRENVFVNCTLPAAPGQLHPCRNSVLPEDEG